MDKPAVTHDQIAAELEKAEILAEIASYYEREELQPGDVTLTALVRKYGLTRRAWTNRMDKLVAEGKFTRHDDVWNPESKRPCIAWRKVEPPSP